MPDGYGIRFELDITDHDGSWITTLKPTEGLEWEYRMKRPGTLLAPVSLFDPGLAQDVPAPLTHDWQLNVQVEPSLGAFELAAGHVTSVNVVGNTQRLKVAGADWLAWLDQPYWGFDYSRSVATRLASDTAADYRSKWSAASGDTQQDVVEDMIATLCVDANDVALTPVLNGAAWAQTMDYRIDWGNSSSVLQHLTTVSDLFDPRGFDFWALWDKSIVCEGPRLLNPASVTPIYTLDNADVIVDYDWVNNGPASTYFVGYGPGTGNMTEYAQSEYAPSTALYRRWRRIANFPPGPALTGSSTITSRVASQAYLERFPQKRLLLTVRPDRLDPSQPWVGFQNFLGEAVDVDYTFPGVYHRIDSFFWVTGQRYYFKRGAPMLDLSLDQLYA